MQHEDRTIQDVHVLYKGRNVRMRGPTHAPSFVGTSESVLHLSNETFRMVGLQQHPC